MDAGGTEEFLGYIFADNDFELCVNGEHLAVDAVPFTKFKSNVVRVGAKEVCSGSTSRIIATMFTKRVC